MIRAAELTVAVSVAGKGPALPCLSHSTTRFLLPHGGSAACVSAIHDGHGIFWCLAGAALASGARSDAQRRVTTHKPASMPDMQPAFLAPEVICLSADYLTVYLDQTPSTLWQMGRHRQTWPGHALPCNRVAPGLGLLEAVTNAGPVLPGAPHSSP